MKLTRQKITGAAFCGVLAAAPFIISWIQIGTKEFFAGLMWGAPAPSVMLWFTLFCAAIGTQLKISAQQAKGCLVGSLIGIAPFTLLWILIGTRSFVYGETGKAAPVAIALITALCGAVISATLFEKRRKT